MLPEVIAAARRLRSLTNQHRHAVEFAFREAQRTIEAWVKSFHGNTLPHWKDRIGWFANQPAPRQLIDIVLFPEIVRYTDMLLDHRWRAALFRIASPIDGDLLVGETYREHLRLRRERPNRADFGDMFQQHTGFRLPEAGGVPLGIGADRYADTVRRCPAIVGFPENYVEPGQNIHKE